MMLWHFRAKPLENRTGNQQRWLLQPIGIERGKVLGPAWLHGSWLAAAASTVYSWLFGGDGCVGEGSKWTGSTGSHYHNLWGSSRFLPPTSC